MRSIRAQLLVTLAATAVAVGFLVYRGTPPSDDLARAVLLSNAQQVERHMRWGVDPNYQSSPPNGLPLSGQAFVFPPLSNSSRPLYVAIVFRRFDIARVLVAHGADVEARDGKGHTALHVAVWVGSLSYVNGKLMSGGGKRILVNIDVGEETRRRALQFAEFLIAHGSDVNAKTNDGLTPLGLAERLPISGPSEMADLLRRHGAKE
jgi:ankyrin repeat protein